LIFEVILAILSASFLNKKDENNQENITVLLAFRSEVQVDSERCAAFGDRCFFFDCGHTFVF
jgi:hypothetical protein